MAKAAKNKSAATKDETASKEKNEGIKPTSKISYEVVQEFRDIVDFSKVHKVGDDASGFEPGRLAELVKSGLVTKK